ncbi:MAG: hypothetical protein AABW51_01620 [Nanoarchaeota archaeon]
MIENKYQPRYDTVTTVVLGKGLVLKLGLRLNEDNATVKTTPSGTVYIEYKK